MNWFKSFWKAATERSERGAHDSVQVFSNFTPRAQQALAFARQEADRFNHHFVGTEHLLLGLIKLGQGTAVAVLRKMGLELETVRLEVERQVGTGPDQKVFGSIPYTPRVKKVLALAAKEARGLNHTYVGTEHILLGLLREGDGVAARVLKSLDVDTEETRQEILRELDPNAPRAAKETVIPQNAESPKPERESVDTSKRYDVYCMEQSQEVVYRNALFKGRKKLFQNSQYELPSDFVELEQADGKTISIARHSIIKFCEQGVTPGCEPVSGKKP